MLLALARKNPVDLMILWRSLNFAPAKSSTFLYFLKRAGVTELTRLSVHWAERTVAIRS